MSAVQAQKTEMCPAKLTVSVELYCKCTVLDVVHMYEGYACTAIMAV